MFINHKKKCFSSYPVLSIKHSSFFLPLLPLIRFHETKLNRITSNIVVKLQIGLEIEDLLSYCYKFMPILIGRLCLDH